MLDDGKYAQLQFWTLTICYFLFKNRKENRQKEKDYNKVIHFYIEFKLKLYVYIYLFCSIEIYQNINQLTWKSYIKVKQSAYNWQMTYRGIRSVMFLVLSKHNEKRTKAF